jgi:peroxiredoxin
MRSTSLLLLAFAASSLAAQSRVDLLHNVEDHYANADTFVVKGTASALIPDTSWRVTYDFETQGVQPAFLPLNMRTPSLQVIALVGNRKDTLAVPGATDPKPQRPVGLAPLGQYNAITRRLIAARKIGDETITLQGRSYSCEIVDATYDFSPDFKPNSILVHKRYWISPADLIVLRETRPMTGFEWIGDVTQFSFDQPPSERMIAQLQRIAALPKDRPDWVGRPMPALTLNQLSGHPVNLAGLRGKPLLLDFWASYCAPCRRATIHAQSLQKQYSSSHLTVLTVTQDTAADARLWTSYNHIDLPVLLDPDGVAYKAFDVTGVPVAILIAADGKIAHYWIGFPDPASMDSVIANNLSPHPTSSDSAP